MNKRRFLSKKVREIEESSSPSFTDNPTFSPMTSLALNFDEAANIQTPCKRLSLASTISGGSPLDLSYDSSCSDFGNSPPEKNIKVNFYNLKDQEKENIPCDPNCSKLNPDSIESFVNSHIEKSNNDISLFSPSRSYNESPDSGYYRSDEDSFGFGKLGVPPLDQLSPINEGKQNSDMGSVINKSSRINFMQPPNCSEKKEIHGINNLFSAPINTDSMKKDTTSNRLLLQRRRYMKRSRSMVDTTPTSTKGLSFNVNKRGRPIDEQKSESVFKRPKIDPEVGTSSNPPNLTSRSSVTDLPFQGRLVRSHSESQVAIMKAVSLSTVQRDKGLVGDYSRQMALPLLKGGRHPELNTIDHHTMAALLKGDFKDKVPNFTVIDCRYPFEYDGGHIKNAVNWYHPEIVIEALNKEKIRMKESMETSSSALIFHCEFSAERGPKYLRLLREEDRVMNNYPTLCFPELYLLEGGYKAFYSSYPDFCDPRNYIKMIDPEFSCNLRYHRSRSKLWSVDNKTIRGKGPIARFDHGEEKND